MDQIHITRDFKENELMVSNEPILRKKKSPLKIPVKEISDKH